jgi:hypothetical protein
MRALLVAAAGVAAFGPQAWAQTPAASAAERIVALFEDVCIAHGADLAAVQAMAEEQGWRALSPEEIESIHYAGVRPGFIVGWEPAAEATITIAASGVISTQMRERARAGERVTAPPPGEVAPNATEADRAAVRQAPQACTVRYAELDPDEIRRGLEAATALGRTLGPSGPPRDMTPYGWAQDGGTALGRQWLISKSQSEWMSITFTAIEEPGGRRGVVEVNQPTR